MSRDIERRSSENSLQPREGAVWGYGKDVAVVAARDLMLFGAITDMLVSVDASYSPALLARDIATLSHLGVIGTLYVEGEHASEAVEIVRELLAGEELHLMTSWGQFKGARIKPLAPYDVTVREASELN